MLLYAQEDSKTICLWPKPYLNFHLFPVLQMFGIGAAVLHVRRYCVFKKYIENQTNKLKNLRSFDVEFHIQYTTSATTDIYEIKSTSEDNEK